MGICYDRISSKYLFFYSKCTILNTYTYYVCLTLYPSESRWYRDDTVIFNTTCVFDLLILSEFINHWFLSGGYIVGSEPIQLIEDAILHLCSNLKDEAVALVDAIAPTDFILNSPIGHSDGQVR